MAAWKQSVLICTVGTAPSVVTETVWALLEKRPRWVPNRIYLVTTTVGAKDCMRAPGHGDRGFRLMATTVSGG